MKLYRSMIPGPDGLPLLGRSARKLGVRTPGDVAVGVDPDVLATAPDDILAPSEGGISTAPDDAINLVPLRRPRALGGRSTDPVGEIDSASLGADLAIRQDSAKHVLIEPARPMTLMEYEQALATIRGRWVRVIG